MLWPANPSGPETGLDAENLGLSFGVGRKYRQTTLRGPVSGSQ